MNIKTTFLIVSTLFVLACSQKEESKTAMPVSPAGSNSSLPFLTTGLDGLLYFSWVEQMDSLTTLKYAKLIDGEWSQPTQIAQGVDWFVNWADYPSVAANEEGMLAHYLAKSAPETFSYNVNVVRKSSTNEWAAPIVPHKDSTDTEHGFVTMIPMKGGLFQMAWLDGRNTGGGHDSAGAMTLRGAVMDMDGNLTDEVELDGRVCDCCQTGGAVTANGPIVIYRNRSEGEIRDMSIVRNVDGQWTAPKIINEDGWEIAGCPVNGPRVDAIGNDLAIAWFTMANQIPKVKVVFSADGGATFDAPILIDEVDPFGRVDVIMIDQNRAMVSWVTEKEDQKMIKARIINREGSTEKDLKITNFEGSRRNGFPQMQKNGDFIYFAWTRIVKEEITSIDMKKVSI